jgi:chloramphenicol-sensitive protein RarD
MRLRSDELLNYLQAVFAYILWGIFPLYWKLLKPVNPFEIICHRILWALMTLLILIGVCRQWADIRLVLKDPKRLALCAVAAVLISINWLVFIWAIQDGYVVESSLGYFMNPMLNVLLGVFLFRERLHPMQWISVAIAGLGLAVMTMQTGQVPFIALTLAVSFALYAAVKKVTIMPAVAGLGMETAILTPITLIALIYFAAYPHDTEPRTAWTWMLLVLGGPITTLPLVLFAASAKSVPMAAMGMLQYIAPSLQFLFGVYLYGEQVSQGRAFGFALVWLALVLFSGFVLVSSRTKATHAAVQSADQ